jgi:tryptophan 2,3-dioxygenase
MFKYLFLIFSIFLAGFSCNNNAPKAKPQNTAIEQAEEQDPYWEYKNDYVPAKNFYSLNYRYIKRLLGLKNVETLRITSNALKDLSFLNNLEQLKELEVSAGVYKEIEIWNDRYRSVDIPEKLFESKGITLKINYPGKE